MQNQIENNVICPTLDGSVCVQLVAKGGGTCLDILELRLFSFCAALPIILFTFFFLLEHLEMHR